VDACEVVARTIARYVRGVVVRHFRHWVDLRVTRPSWRKACSCLIVHPEEAPFRAADQSVLVEVGDAQATAQTDGGENEQ
jgi:hypothetical protein